MSSRAVLRLTVVGEVGAKAGEEARIKAIHEYLANADRKHLLVNERTRDSKDASIILVDRGENRIPSGIIVCLPNVVEGSMRLLGVPRAELVEQMNQDGGSCQADDFQVDQAAMVVESVFALVRLKSGQSRSMGPS